METVVILHGVIRSAGFFGLLSETHQRRLDKMKPRWLVNETMPRALPIPIGPASRSPSSIEEHVLSATLEAPGQLL